MCLHLKKINVWTFRVNDYEEVHIGQFWLPRYPAFPQFLIFCVLSWFIFPICTLCPTLYIYYSIWNQRLKLYINIMRQQNNLKCLDGNKNGIQYTPPLSRKLIIMQIILVTQHIQCSECFQCSINDTQQVTSSSNTSCSTDCCQRIDRIFQRVLSEQKK